MMNEAIEWLCATFHFTERLRSPRPGEVSQYVVVHLDDVDQHFEHARRCGARILKPTLAAIDGRSLSPSPTWPWRIGAPRQRRRSPRGAERPKPRES